MIRILSIFPHKASLTIRSSLSTSQKFKFVRIIFEKSVCNNVSEFMNLNLFFIQCKSKCLLLELC